MESVKGKRVIPYWACHIVVFVLVYVGKKLQTISHEVRVFNWLKAKGCTYSVKEVR